MTFKKIFLSTLLALTLIGCSIAGYKHPYKWRSAVPPVLTHGNPKYVQVRASHMIAFLDSDGEPAVYCSGTVIGQHAILTAAHCTEAGEFKTINLDRSTTRYHLIASSFDGRDHVIILVDGPAFKDIVPYVTREPKIGEPVLIEGFGEEVYPAVEKTGRVTNTYDPSEVDAEQKMFYFSNPVISGDSGAAVYSLDGSIVGIVTWRIAGNTGAGYSLNFLPKIIQNAQTFDGKDSF